MGRLFFRKKTQKKFLLTHYKRIMQHRNKKKLKAEFTDKSILVKKGIKNT